MNLFWAADRILNRAIAFSGNAEELKKFVVSEAQKIADEDAEANRAIGKNGAELINDGDVILTHCNAGELATVEYGTALGVIRAAWKQGKKSGSSRRKHARYCRERGLRFTSLNATGYR